LKYFGKHHPSLEGDLGFTGVLHTHSRQLHYHPHLHFIVPAGSFCKKQSLWKCSDKTYFLPQKAIAKVFRARLLKSLSNHFSRLPLNIPKKWVVDCRHVGSGLPALQYLSRYLYRGVISERQIVRNDGSHITFYYKESKTKKRRYQTLKGEDFIYRLLQHVLPKGFRRVRDYGFLHGNAKRLLHRIQLCLRVILPPCLPDVKPQIYCRECGSTEVNFFFTKKNPLSHPIPT
ncbi:IS91 family transposase, partial [Marinibactrum halimedae]